MEIVELISGQPHSRNIYWYTDIIGGAGKTTFASWIVAKYPKEVFRCTNSKSKDIAYAYKGERIVIFDLARCEQSKINYGIIETLKNGFIFSPKYESVSKHFAIPHTIVFANANPKE